MANEIIAEIELDLRKVQQGLNKFKKKAGDAGKKGGKKLGDSLEKRAGVGIKSLTRRLLGLGAVLAAAFGGRKILQLAAAQEEAITGINAALRSTGEFSKEASQDIQDFASALQEVTGIGDEVILQGAAIGQAFTQNAEQTRELTAAALDFSVAAQISFIEAVRRLGRATQGSTDDIAKFAPEIRNLTKEQLAAGEATRILAKRFEGFAAQQAKTFAGATAGAANAFGDLLEQIGFVITQSPEIIAIIQLITKEFVALGKSIDVGEAQIQLKALIQTVLDFAQVIITNVGPPLELFINGVVQGFKAIQFGAAELLAFFDEEFRPIADQLREDLSFEKIFDFDSTATAENFVMRVQEVVDQANPILADAGLGMKNAVGKPIEDLSFDNIATQMKKQAAVIKVTAKDIAKSLNQSIGRGASNAFQQFGAALATGRDALGAFGLAVLSVFGDILIQLGEQTLAVGLLMQGVPILFGLQGGAAVAAGIGMIVAGGFLKAVAGGGGGGAAAGGGAAPATAGVAPATLEAPLEPIGEIAEEIETGPTTAVTVNVQGDILDRRETGLALVELIQESIGTQGTTFVTQGT